MFLTLTMKEGGTVGFGGNQTGKIIGTGTIDNSSISINNVWFVDGLRHNLLSISQFCDNGYDVMFDKNNCTVINMLPKPIHKSKPSIRINPTLVGTELAEVVMGSTIQKQTDIC